MTNLEWIGCSLIGLGAPTILFFYSVASNPIQVIICFASAFFWIVSMILSGACWMAVIPLRNILVFGVVCSVIFQELFRLMFFKLFEKTHFILKRLWAVEGLSDSEFSFQAYKISYVSGFGYGLVSCFFSTSNLLAAMVGPGTIGLAGNDKDFLLTSALMSLSFFLLHICWSIILYHGITTEKHLISFVPFISHVLISCLSLANPKLGPIPCIIVSYCMLFGLFLWSYRIVGGKFKRLLFINS